MTHTRAVATMVLVTLLWSIAGIVSRQLESAAAFEVTFWRSATNAIALAVLLGWRSGWAALRFSLRHGGKALWVSSMCWCVMFTAFMLALTLTTVANVLVTMALTPLFTALIGRFALQQRLPWRTWLAIALAGVGIVWMQAAQLAAGSSQHLSGTLVALTVPVAGALMWTLLQSHAAQATKPGADLTPAVLVGAVLSAALTLPLSWPLQATAHDIGWLSLLGLFQLAIPCMLAVAAGKVLPAPEAALLGLLEVLFGVSWAWLGTSESPTVAVAGGGALVLLALAGNELLALRGAHRPASQAADRGHNQRLP